MHPILNGLLFGLIFIFSFGPAFFSLIQTSVQKGFRKAIFLAVGISLSDVGFATLALMGVSSLLEDASVKICMGSIGAIVLIVYGIYNWFKQTKVYPDRIDGDTEITYLKYLAKGLVLNGFNPFIIIFWLGLVGVVAVNYEYDQSEQRYFFVGVLITIFTFDVLKAFLANRLRTFVTPKRILIMNRAVAVILVLFGVNLIYYIYDKFGSV